MNKAIGITFFSERHLSELTRLFTESVTSWQSDWCISGHFSNVTIGVKNSVPLTAQIDGYQAMNVLSNSGHVYLADDEVDWCRLIFDLERDQVPNDDIKGKVFDEARRHLVGAILGVNGELLMPPEEDLGSPAHLGLWSQLFLNFGADSVSLWVPNILLSQQLGAIRTIKNPARLVERKVCIGQSLCELSVRLPAGQVAIEALSRLRVGDILNIEADLNRGVNVTMDGRIVASGTPCKKAGKLAVVLD